MVIDAAPLHHRRRPAELVENLRRIAQGSEAGLVAAEVRKHIGPVGVSALTLVLNLPASTVEQATEDPEILRVDDSAGTILICRQAAQRVETSLIRALEKYRIENPFSREGRTARELVGLTGLEQNETSLRYLGILLGQLADQGALARNGLAYRLAGEKHGEHAAADAASTVVENYLMSSGMAAPLPSELFAESSREGIDEKGTRAVLKHLVEQKRAYRAEETWLAAGVVDRCRKILVDALIANPVGLTVAQFRDLIKGNRKICLLLLGIYDTEGTTERRGDMRVPGRPPGAPAG